MSPHSCLRCHRSSLRYCISCRQQLRPAAREHLRPCLYALHIIGRGQLLVRLKVFVEVEKVAAVVGRICNRDEAVYRRGSVCADDEVELGVSYCWGGGRSGRIAVVAKGGDAPKIAEPDHDFVGLCTGAGGTDEGVVGDVGADS